MKSQYESHMKDYEVRLIQIQVHLLALLHLLSVTSSLPQNEMAQKQQENVLLSEKLRNSHQLTEERLRNADDRIASFEKEITASRCPHSCVALIALS